MGKTISTVKLRALQGEVERFRDPGTFVVLLDPDQNPKDKANGQEHHIEVAYRNLCQVFGRSRVAKLYLPAGHDAGSMPPSTLWPVIHTAAAKQRVSVSVELLQPR